MMLIFMQAPQLRCFKAQGPQWQNPGPPFVQCLWDWDNLRFTVSSLLEEEICHLPWWQSCLCGDLGSQTCWGCWHCWPLGWREGGCGSPSRCNWPYVKAFVPPAAPGRPCWLGSVWGAWRAWRARLCCGGQQSTDTETHIRRILHIQHMLCNI